MEVVFVLVAIINIAALICYFVLVYKVSMIEKKMIEKKVCSTGVNFEALFNYYMLLSEREKARELLIEHITTHPNFSYAFESNSSDKAIWRANLLEPYLPYFELLDMDVSSFKIEVDPTQIEHIEYK